MYISNFQGQNWPDLDSLINEVNQESRTKDEEKSTQITKRVVVGEIEPLIIKVIYGPDKPCLPVLFYMYTGIKYNYTIYLVDDTMIWQVCKVCKEMCR